MSVCVAEDENVDVEVLVADTLVAPVGDTVCVGDGEVDFVELMV